MSLFTRLLSVQDYSTSLFSYNNFVWDLTLIIFCCLFLVNFQDEAWFKVVFFFLFINNFLNLFGCIGSFCGSQDLYSVVVQ